MRNKWLALAVLLLMLATIFQAALDRTPAGTKGGGGFPSAESLTRFLGGIRQYLAYVYFIKADKLYHTYGGNQEIIAYYVLVTYLDPHYVDAYYVASDLIYRAGRQREALDLALRGVANNPDSADLYAALADIYIREKRMEDARDAFQKAIGLQGKFFTRNMLLKGLAVIYHALGDYEISRRFYLEAVIYNAVRLLFPDVYIEEEEQEGLIRGLLRVINNDCDIVLPDGFEAGS